MSNVFNLVSEETYIEQTDKLAVYLAAIAAKGDGTLRPTSWSDVQSIVRNGLASKVFAIGDQLTCQRDGVNLVWDVIGIDHDTPADPQFTHSMTLQLHDCFPTNMQFDADEAFYYAENGLAAGTYHFVVSDTSYQFTLDNAVPVGGQLFLNWSANTPTSISVCATVGGATEGSSISVTQGAQGTALGTITDDGDFTNNINSLARARYGSDNYKESAIRQWLNSSASAGSVWTPQTNYDRPPLWASDMEGFLNGLDADFLAVVGNTHIVTSRNGICEDGVDESTDDKFFLLSRREVFAGDERQVVTEGEPYPHYSDYSDLNEAGIGNDSNRIKYKNGTAQVWMLRTPYNISAMSFRHVSVAGNVSSGNAKNNYGVVPACNII